MTYKIGTRVKCIKTIQGDDSSWIGRTGIVVSGKITIPGKNLTIRVDQPAKCQRGISWPPGTPFQCTKECWEPIAPDGQRAGESDLCKPLDHLLTRLKGVEA